jgi:streptomycin 6-kinase
MDLSAINKTLCQNIIAIYGIAGDQWLKNLPEFLLQCENELGIKIYPSFDNLTYNYVAPAIMSDGTEAVFKCGMPNPELTTEIAALTHFNGNGVARLFSSDATEGWLLIEKLTPGTMLVNIDNDDAATEIAANIMQKMWKPTDSKEFPDIKKLISGFSRLYERFNGGTGPFPKAIVKRAHHIAQELLESMHDTVLLHGDLHHYNILSSKRDSWLAIDPKGIIGEREFEVGALMKNPEPLLSTTDNLKSLFSRRIDIIVEITKLERYKIIGWSLVMAVLSAWWEFEDLNQYNNLLIHCANKINSSTILIKSKYPFHGI